MGYWFFDAIGLRDELINVNVENGNVLTAEGSMSESEANVLDLVYFDKHALESIEEVIKVGTQVAKNLLIVNSYNERVTGDATGNAEGSYEKTLQWIKIIAKHMYAVGLDSFDRDYTTDFHAPNVLRSFEIEKLGDDGKKLSGAKFTLYSDEECSNELASGETDEHGKIVVSKEEDGSKGTMKFNLELAGDNFTTYYLKETKAADGYEINDTVIKVNVDDSGVYIDAGNDTDEVSVRSSLVGSVEIVNMFGISDGYNETLREIEAVEYLLDDFTLDRTKWIKGDDSIIYTQANKHNNDGYIPDANGLQYFEVEEGLVVMYIKQHNPESDYEEDISKENIAALFEVVQTVVVIDQQIPPTEPPTEPTGPSFIEPVKPEIILPQTGDDSNVMIWLIIALVSGLALLGACIKRIISKGKRESINKYN